MLRQADETAHGERYRRSHRKACACVGANRRRLPGDRGECGASNGGGSPHPMDRTAHANRGVAQGTESRRQTRGDFPDQRPRGLRPRTLQSARIVEGETL